VVTRVGERLLHVFFDLDGTLTDPREGITRCLRYALQKLGYSSPEDAELERYIGPPLQQNFATLLQSHDAELIARAVSCYRERFASVGLFENAVYPGIEDALTVLQEQQRRLYVVTSKPTIFAKQILDHFGLSRFFRSIYGSELDGTRADKTDLIAYVLTRENISTNLAIMVGDREHDVQGALRNAVGAVGVLWGYGSRQELLQAGASSLCDNPAHLTEVLSSHLPSDG
jgi:phosphoglycolate phosphatase